MAHQRDTLQQTWAQHQYRAQRVEALDELHRLVFEHSTVERQLHQQAQMQVQAQEKCAVRWRLRCNLARHKLDWRRNYRLLSPSRPQKSANDVALT